MGWVEWTDRLYWRVQPWLVPGLRNSQHVYAEELKRALPSARRWLDLGCGHEFLPVWMPADERQLNLNGCRTVGIDADSDALRRHVELTYKLHGNIESLPFRDDIFDLVTANMVVEHVEHPASLFREVRRILAPGGQFLVHTPNEHGYTTVLTKMIPERLRASMAGLMLRREPRDVYRTHYRANTSGMLRALAQDAELDVVAMRHIESSPQLIALPPLLLVELMFARVLRSDACATLRPCLLAAFQKRAERSREST